MLVSFTVTVATKKDLFSQTQIHVFLEFQRMEARQTLHRGV